MAKAGKIRIKVDDHATKVLKSVGLALKGPEVTAEMQRGAEIMANAARQRAPVRTGTLKKGIYTASTLRDGKPEIVRQRGARSQNVMLNLRFPPRKGQVLVVSGVFYGRWVEKGRKKVAAPTEGNAKRRSVGRMRRRPFFLPGIRAARASAESYIQRRLERLVRERLR